MKGHEVSGFIKAYLPLYIDRALPRSLQQSVEMPVSMALAHTIRTAFTTAFLALNQDLVRKTSIDTSFSGSTAITLLVRGSFLLCANVGDSRAVLGKKTSFGWRAVPLSSDHKPDLPKERERILAYGGRVEPFVGTIHADRLTGGYVGPSRVWMSQEQIPGLAMSRSLGDFVASQLGVISEPDFTQVELTPEDKFVIVASDGIWEFLSSQKVSTRQCVEMVGRLWEEGEEEGATEVLVTEAVAAWRRTSTQQEDEVVDDITVVLCFFTQSPPILC